MFFFFSKNCIKMKALKEVVVKLVFKKDYIFATFRNKLFLTNKFLNIN